MTKVIVVLVEWREVIPGPGALWNVAPHLTMVFPYTDDGRGKAHAYAVGLDPHRYSYQIEVCPLEL